MTKDYGDQEGVQCLYGGRRPTHVHEYVVGTEVLSYIFSKEHTKISVYSGKVR